MQRATPSGCDAGATHRFLGEEDVAFFRSLGFEVEGRSERDGFGKPLPLVRLRERARSRD